MHHPRWIRASVDPAAFAHEQASLGRLWTFVGFATDLATDGDWFRTTVGGRSIFVQRFGAAIRAFENRCAHRFYPLRKAERGRGPVVCGFHHWRYNEEGKAVGIPKCEEMFGTIPRMLDARLQALDLETCGGLIFVRFPSGSRETLRDYLADGHDFIAALCAPTRPPYHFRQDVAAHWKFSHHVSLDDYHIVAVHPTSFGKNGYLKPEVVNYVRFGRHSALIEMSDADALTSATARIAAGTYQPEQYLILNLFPNFLIAQVHAVNLFGGAHWYIAVFRYLPVAASSSQVQVWLYPSPYTGPESPLSRRLRPGLNRLLPPIVAFFTRRIMMEDNAMCEGQQSVAHQVEGEQLLSAQEQRIAWFEEAYAEALFGNAEEGRSADTTGSIDSLDSLALPL